MNVRNVILRHSLLSFLVQNTNVEVDIGSLWLEEACR
jgi:hypothetical protein